MIQSKLGKLIVIAVVGIVGLVLLFQPSSPAPETMSRQAAVQSAFAPNRQGSSPSNSTVATEENIITYGVPVSPVEVNLASVPSRAADGDEMLLAYEAGDLDLDVNEGPVSDAVYQALIEESKQQSVDPSVQNYLPEQNSPSFLDGTAQTTPLLTGVNFKAIDYTQSSQLVPPDPDIMVGKSHIVIGVNTSFQIFDKAGNSLYGPVLYEDFWFNASEGKSVCGNGSADLFFFDPFSQYDEENGRYILGITAFDPTSNGGNNGWACIAISQTDSATGSWWLYSFNGNPGDGTDYFFDFPHIGVGQDALYLGANMFIYDSYFVRNHIFALEKDVMYTGASAKSVKFNIDDRHFTIQPAKIKGYTTGGWPTNPNEPHYFVTAAWGNNQNTLTIQAFSDPWGSPSFSLVGAVTVNTYSLSVSQPQLGGSYITGNDNRLLDVEYWNGKLWATHNIGCNPGDGTVNCIRWYEIDISSGTPSLVQQGTFASNDEYRSFPDLAVNVSGDMLIGYTKTSSSMYPSVYIAGREADDAASMLKSETLVHAGEAVYFGGDVPYRWGDYTGMVLDPDGKTFWYVGEYSRSPITARWSTWVSAHTWPTEFTYLPVIQK